MKKNHRNTFIPLFLCLFLLAPAVARAQDEVPELSYTLEECIDTALRRSPDILTATEEIKRTSAYIFENWASVLSVSADGTYSFMEPSGIGSSSYEKYNVGLNASIPLFTGGRTVGALKIAYLNREIAREQYRYAVASTIYNTRVAFYSVLLAEEQLSVWTEEVDVLDRNLEITKKNFMNGLAPKYDVNRIEVALANARTSLIKAKNDVTIAYDTLKDILDLDLDKPVAIEGELVYNPRDRAMDEYLSAAETRSPQIGIKKLTEQVAAKNVMVAVGSYFPTISAFASYDTSSLNELDISFNGRDWDFTGGLTVSMPISDLAVTAAKHKQAKALYEEAKIDTRDTEKSVKLSIRKAYFDLEEAKEIIGLQESNVALAQENLDRSELRYVNGVETLLDLLDARLAVTNARLNYINAIYGYEESIARLNMIMGQERAGW